MNNSFPTPEELAREAREALRKRPAETSREHFTRLVRKGFINAQGQVTRLIGGSAEPEPNFQTWTPDTFPEQLDSSTGPGKAVKKPRHNGR